MRFHHLRFVLLGVFATLPVAAAMAQPASDDAQAQPAAQAATDPEFDALMQRWRGVIDDLRKLKVKYAVAQDAEKEALDRQYDALIGEGNNLIPQLREAGKKAYEKAPNADPQLTRFLVKLAMDDALNDHYKAAFEVAELLIKHDCGEKSIYMAGAIAAFALDDYKKAAEYFKIAEEAGVPTPDSVNYAADAVPYQAYWEEEQKIREAEAAADDLPRVKLETTKGDIILELFENEAPDTVGNFVSLVEAGKYDGTIFHRVLKGFMAQGGDPKGDGTGGPGYTIYCEIEGKKYRKHFAGSLSMAHAGKDTGGSQFFITFRATPHLNGKHTCFGRVIEGMDVVEKLQRRDPMNPGKAPADKIVKATVLRKRDHAYVPRKTE
jgi:cyclophilin family peptidyl-prolyl cis-trans isomerase